MPFDPEQLRELLPDLPRFLSFGTVEDEQPVEFVEGVGPVVNVALQPSRVPVRCRVGMPSAGAGEGSYAPFVAGDEVLVAMPSGPRGECAILCRLSNDADAFPTTVGGQDSTQNKISFTRRRTAHFEEYEGPWAVFSQPSGAFASISREGNVTLRDGSKGALQLSADAFGYQDEAGEHVLQLDLTESRLAVRAADAFLTLASSGPSAILCPGALSISTAGNPAHEHAISTEAVANLLVNLLMALGAANPGPILGAALGAAAPGVVASAVSLASVAPLNPAVAAALFGAFSAATLKPPGQPGQGQSFPGIGCPGLLVG